MNKGELIDHIADSAGITKAQATDALNAVVGGVSKTLKKRRESIFDWIWYILYL